jgi:hypothetical protein
MYSNLTELQSQQLFAQQMAELSAEQDKDNAETVIILFEEERRGLDKLPLLVNMFINPYMTPETIKFAISCSDKEPADYFIDLVNLGDDESALKIAKIMVNYFNLDVETWKELLELTEDFEDEEYENVSLRAFFKEQIGKLKVLNGPSWVKPMNKPKLPLHPKFPSVKDATNGILKHMKPNKDKDYDELVNSVIAKYAVSPSLEKIAMARINSSFDDKHFFREFGPVNTTYEMTRPYDNVCNRNGGCRMFLCNEFEDTDYDGDEIDCMSRDDQFRDWFRGKCQECKCKIGKKHHAVRLPLLRGGWKGCYCSFECAGNDAENQLQLLILGTIKGQLETIGIRDR